MIWKIILYVIITGLIATLQQKFRLDFNKEIALKSILALGSPFLLITIAYAIGKVVGLENKITNDLTPLISIMFIGILIGSFWRGNWLEKFFAANS